MTPGRAKNKKKYEYILKTLAESDRGSWFNQEEQWQSNDSTSMASSLSSPSSSTRKLKASKQPYLNDSFTASSDSETNYSGSSKEISVIFTSVILPMRQQNKIYPRTNILSKKGLFACISVLTICVHCFSPSPFMRRRV